MKHEKLTYKIIGCAMEVHKHLGNGFTPLFDLFINGIRECFAFQEVVCQRALSIEMTMQGIAYSREHEMEIRYKGNEIGTRRIDFFL
jgi:hypothetical protein